jgi:serine palmitoyltransferase
MSSPIAPTSPPRQDLIFNKHSLSKTREAQPCCTGFSEADAFARVRHSASFTSTPPRSISSSTTTLSEDTVPSDSPYDNSDGLAYHAAPPTSEQVLSADHLQFGFCANKNYRYNSVHKPGTKLKEAHQQDPPYYILFTTYLSYFFLICMGHIRDFFGKRLHPASYRHLLPFDVSHLFPLMFSSFRLGMLLTWPLICVFLTGLRTSQLGL